MSAVPTLRPWFGRLSLGPIGISRITARLGHTRPRWKKPQPELAGQPPGHGEKIWIWDNVHSKQVFYSLSPEWNAPKAMRQLTFIAKKSKPAMIRRDYWKQLCIVEFAEGRGDVGLSVYQRLREFRRRHELEWKSSLLYERDGETGKLRTLTRVERGKKIMEQKENAIADLAAVLGGGGRGNRVTKASTKGHDKATPETGGQEGITVDLPTLVPATIRWANSFDKNYATEWPENVIHELLPGGKDWKLVGDKPLEGRNKEDLGKAETVKEATGKGEPGNRLQGRVGTAEVEQKANGTSANL